MDPSHTASLIESGRQAYDRRAWDAAYRSLSGADEAAPLGAEDLWRVAMSAYLIGRDQEFVVLLERAHHAHLEAGDPVGAARCAFWLGFHLADRGEVGPATGWFGRAGRLLDDAGGDRVERGYLLLPIAHQQLGGGGYEASYRTAGEAAEIGQRFGDPDLLALALHLQGHALMNRGLVEEGLALLDEAMVAVTAEELSPLVTGLVYCSVIGACRRVYALGRAHEWTAALDEWCRDQPELVPYRGQCLVYRAEILQLHGEWGNAIEEARRASQRTAGPGRQAAAMAFYRQGEIHRLRGELGAAEEAYRNASRLGREPQPGLSLLRLAQGDREAATAAIRRVVGETEDRLHRSRLLPAFIEIALAVGDIDGARRACGELEQIAATYGTSVLDTIVAHARGAVALADDDPLAALVALRRAGQGWQVLGAPYEAARVRVLLALACRELGDDDTASLELDAARAEFEELGAAPDLAHVAALDRDEPTQRDHGLTPRELEVLALVATGRTNRAIAERLFISDRTVARHLSNIYSKLGLSSRSAATAYAYEHELV